MSLLIVFILMGLANVTIESSKEEFDHSISEIWKANCILELCEQMNITTIGVLIFKDYGSGYNDILSLLLEKSILVTVLTFTQRNPKQLFENAQRLIQLKVEYVVLLSDFNSNTSVVWRQINDFLSCKNRWIFFAGLIQRKAISKEILKSEDCSFSDLLFLTRSKFRTSNTSKDFDIYSPLCFGNYSGRQIVLSTEDSMSLKKHKSFIEAFVFKESFGREKLTLKIASNESPPYLFMNIIDSKKLELIKGPDVYLLKTLQEKLGFRYEVTTPADGEWGRLVKGRWTGLIGMVNRKEADIAIGFISVTYPRDEACDFTVPYETQESVIITTAPETKSKAYALVMPFTVEVWALILVSVFVNVILLYIVSQVNAVLTTTKPPNFNQVFWYLIAILCAEGGRITTFRGPSAILVLGIWLWFVVVIQCSYSGLLMSFLSFPGLEPTIDNLQDLASAVKNRRFKCGSMKGTSNYEMLTHLEGSLKILSESVANDDSSIVLSPVEGLQKVLSEKYAFLSPVTASEYVANEIGRSKFYTSEESIGNDIIGIATRKGFPFKKAFNSVIRRVTEAGLVAKWMKDEISTFESDTSRRQVHKVSALSVSEIKGALLLCCYGYVLSSMVFIVECLGWIPRKLRLRQRATLM